MTQDARAFNWDSISVKAAATADPAAGADYANITVPAGKKWLLISFTGQLATDVNAGNRFPFLQVSSDGTNVDKRICGDVAIVASSTKGVSFACIANTVDTVPAATGGLHIISMFPVEIPAGGILLVSVSGKKAGDDWGVAYYSYKEAPA